MYPVLAKFIYSALTGESLEGSNSSNLSDDHRLQVYTPQLRDMLQAFINLQSGGQVQSVEPDYQGWLTTLGIDPNQPKKPAV
jgi:hypothetical protein